MWNVQCLVGAVNISNQANKAAHAYGVLLLINNISQVRCHISIHSSTPASKVEQHCDLAEGCVHDTIPVCGKMGDQTRTFLDLCDLLEYACDTSQIYVHVEDVEGCPAEKKEVIIL
ncbi:hypothetical protein PYW07_008934 [Mythimna separata]|uniref:Uncharacterized protein n=1 Tax=Mythimna separata TaxID=271217 RepID=A0AAD7YBG4_MYTSE|nr:hypothetical protein PYW07_008934 [Mythimna separata]